MLFGANYACNVSASILNVPLTPSSSPNLRSFAMLAITKGAESQARHLLGIKPLYRIRGFGHTMADVPYAGAEAVREAFRIGVLMDDVSQSCNLVA